MKNFKNCLLGIEINEQCFNYLKEELQNNYSHSLMNDLFALPCMKYETKHKLSLLFSLFEENEINDSFIDMLCDLLSNISEELWQAYTEQLQSFIEEKYISLSRHQLLLLANTIEIMYAKGYAYTFKLANLIYQRISLHNNEFNSYSDENVRIKLAKIAYSANKYNINEKLSDIQTIKKQIENADRKYLLGAVNYYKGLSLEAASYIDDYNDASHYIWKSKSKEFKLADIYLCYRQINSETSSECRKA